MYWIYYVAILIVLAFIVYRLVVIFTWRQCTRDALNVIEQIKAERRNKDK